MSRLRAYVKKNRPVRAGLFLAQNAAHAARSTVLPKARPADVHRRLAAMVRVKNEARFLPEWLAYHVGLGVEHAYIYDNNSDDDITSVMAPFVERGLATVVPWPTVPASPSAEQDFLARFGPSCEWVAFLDADEFVVEAQPGALADLLAAHPRWPGLALNSRYFGSAGHETIPAGLVTEHFDRADRFATDHVKVIARPAAIARRRNAHNFYYRWGRLARTPEGRRVFGSFVRPNPTAELVLHHYVYRSRQDYEAKARRGYSTAIGARERARRIELVETEFHKHNDVKATVPLSARHETARLLAELGYPDEIHRSGSDRQSA